MAPGRLPRSSSWPGLLVLYQRNLFRVISLIGFSGFLTSTPVLNMPLLAILSFVCAVFLAVFIPVQRIRTSVPRLSIILWLLGHNLVHAINALVWSGNVGIHVPVWCDIVTNFTLGVNVALPVAFLCVSRQLEFLSSSRPIPSHPRVVRNQLIFDICMCYLLPIIYILLHLVVQDYRFDLVEDLGCSASVDPSGVGISLIWIPPLLICSISTIFLALSIKNSFRQCSVRFTMHLESRSTMSSSSFFRCLVVSMTTTTAAGLVYIFCSFSGPALHPWSWATVHRSMSEINIVSSQDELESIQLAWRGGFAVTVLYLLLSFCLGEETRDIFKWIRKKATHENLKRFVLPMHISKHSKTRPSTFEFKSGWDDMLDVTKVPKTKTISPRFTAISTCSSPAPTISTVVTEDDVFISSTLSYLNSPTAKTLGLSGSRNAAQVPSKPRMSPDASPIVYKATDNLLLPPPNSPLPSIPVSCYASRSRSPRNPRNSSLEKIFGNPVYPTSTRLPSSLPST